MARKCLEGLQFGHLSVLAFESACAAGHTSLWRCRCACGRIAILRATNLKSGNSTSCGCVHGIAIDDPITQTQLKKLVRYDLNAGVFIRIVPGRACEVGAELGTFDKSTGYIRVSIESQKYWAHRLAWFYRTGAWPGCQIDHIDSNRANNAWKNLRLANQTQNNGNAKKPITNTSGYKGVSFDSKRQVFVAQIGFKNKNYRLGDFLRAEEAARAYDVAARQKFGEYARTNFGA